MNSLRKGSILVLRSTATKCCCQADTRKKWRKTWTEGMQKKTLALPDLSSSTWVLLLIELKGERRNNLKIFKVACKRRSDMSIQYNDMYIDDHLFKTASTLTVFLLLWPKTIDRDRLTDLWYIFGHRLSFFLDLPCQLGKAFMDIDSRLCADFKEIHVMFFGKHTSLFIGHLPFIIKIAFGSQQYFADIFGRVGLDLFDPVGYIVVGTSISYRICQDDSGRSFVIGLGYVPESLLPSCVPDLHFDPFVVNIQHFYLEVDTNGSYIVFFEDSLAEVGQEVCFANSTVSDNDDFE